MKNLKLLLATTALLSMEAFQSHAIDDKGGSVHINVTADIVEAIEINYERMQDIYFGKLINPRSGENVIISASESAQEATGSAKLVNNRLNSQYGPKQGLIPFAVSLHQDYVGNASLHVIFPQSIDLIDGNTKCGTVTFTHEIIGGDFGEEEIPGDEVSSPSYNPYAHNFDGVRFGGTFTVTQDNLGTVECGQSVTVTLMYQGT